MGMLLNLFKHFLKETREKFGPQINTVRSPRRVDEALSWELYFHKDYGALPHLCLLTHL